MDRLGFAAISRNIWEEKSLKYIGAANIKLDNLNFPRSDGLDQKNVKRLAKLFKEQRSCTPGETMNRVPAIVSEIHLQDALEISKLSREKLLPRGGKFAKLDFPPGFRLECLRGEDRVQAAREILTSPEPRWIVDLFAADISDETKRDLAEAYASENKPDDGEFYYKIREYQGVFGQENQRRHSTWLARLAATSPKGHKRERLEQLLRHPRFSLAFDGFQHLPALYQGMRLSAVNKFISMGCNEELLHYLRHIKDFFYDIFDNNEGDMRRLDRWSLSQLQLKAPGACRKVAEELKKRIDSGEILGAFDRAERERIWSKICAATVDCVVPSLFSFFEDCKYIKDAALCFKRILRLGRRETIRSALDIAYYSADEQRHSCLVQVSFSSFKSIPTNGADHFDIACRQLWLFARRHCVDIPATQKRKFAGAQMAAADEIVLFHFAMLAQKLGFRSREINKLLESDPDRQIARRLLLTARKPDQFKYEDIESSITVVTQAIEGAHPIKDGEIMDTDEYEVAADRKAAAPCGRPLVLDQNEDKPLMFLDKLHGPVPRQTSELSSFFIQRSIYFAFFGRELSVSLDAMQAAPEEEVADARSKNATPTIGERAQMLLKIGETEDRLARLEATENNKGLVIQQLEDEEKRLRSAVKGLASTIESLTEKELRLRETIDSQDVCRDRVEKTRAAAAEEREPVSTARHEETADLDLEAMIRNVFDSDDENMPLPLFSQASPLSTHSEARQTAEASSELTANGKVRIKFVVREENGEWIEDQEVVVDPLEPSAVKQLAIEYLQKGMVLFGMNKRALHPDTCFERVTANGSYTIYAATELVNRRPTSEEPQTKHRKIE